MDEAYVDSKNIWEKHRAQMNLVAEELLKRETLDAQTFKELIDQTFVPMPT